MKDASGHYRLYRILAFTHVHAITCNYLLKHFIFPTHYNFICNGFVYRTRLPDDCPTKGSVKVGGIESSDLSNAKATLGPFAVQSYEEIST